MNDNLQEEKFIYFIEFEEGNIFSKLEFNEPLEDIILRTEDLNRYQERQAFTFVESKEGYWINYALIKVFRRV